MSKLTPNREARAAWVTRHGLNPDEILDGPYEPRTLPDGRLRYELHRWKPSFGSTGDGRLAAETVVVDVPADDLLPPTHIVEPDARADARAEFTAEVQRMVDARMREYVASLERMCEAALTDPTGRGILVLDHEDGSYEMSLDADVPYGSIHHRQVRP